jgi:hypothetical protein
LSPPSQPPHCWSVWANSSSVEPASSWCNPGWSIVTASTPFSTFAGVMAAVVFAGLVLIITLGETNRSFKADIEFVPTGLISGFLARRVKFGHVGATPISKSAPDVYRRAIASLLAAFSALIVATFIFAAISGARDVMRADMVGVVASGVIAAGTANLFYALGWVIALTALPKRVAADFRWVINVAILLSGLFVLLALDEDRWVIGGRPFQHSLVGITWGVPLILFPLIGIVVRRVHDRRSSKALSRSFVQTICTAWSYLLLIAATSVFGVIGNMHRYFTDSIGLKMFRLSTALVVGVYFFLLELTAPSAE